MPLPVVMIPGLNCTEILFRHQIDVLSQSRDVIIADHGYHDSFGAIVRELLANTPNRFDLVGLSLGGYLSFEVLRQAPQRVRRLALLNTSSIGDTTVQTKARREAIALAERGEFMKASLANLKITVAKSRADDHQWAAEITRMATHTGVDAWRNQMFAIMGRAVSLPLLPSIHTKTLVVVGDEDQLTPPHLARQIANGIADAKLEVVENCGHMSTMEHPEQLTQLLLDHFGVC